MGFGLHTTQKWQNRNAILITATTGGLDSEITERFERRKWTVSRSTSSVENAIQEITSGRASFLIVNDHPELPAPYVLRQLLNFKVAFFTPTIVLSTHKDGKEKSCFSNLMALQILEKPAVPSRFIDVFEYMLFQWSNAELAEMYAAGQQFLKGNVQTCVRSLAKLIANREIAGQASCCLALFLRENGDFKTAEKILLSALRQSAKNVGVLVSLVDLYLKAAMPFMAQRLLQSANTAYDTPLTLSIDTLHTHLLLNDLNGCIPILEKMIARDYMPDFSRQVLSRILFAEGLQDKLQHHLKNQPSILAKIQYSWSSKAEQMTLQKTG